MGFKLLIGDYEFENAEFSVQEAATPLAAGDTSGAVGTFNVAITKPDIYAETARPTPLSVIGPAALHGAEVRLSDTRQGFTLGRVTSTQDSKSSNLIRFTVTSRLGELNLYQIQAPPIVGTLAQAFSTYVGLAGVTEDFYVDPEIASRNVILPGWHGELWYSLKQMAAALDCDLSLVSGVIVLRPIRARIATQGRDLDRSFSIGGGSLAQFIEIYQYNNQAITDRLVYPPGGWTEEVPVYTVNSGEYIEEILELSASVSSIVQPVIQSFVSRDHGISSVYTVTGDDGFNVTPAAWNARGGSLRLEINPDTTSLTLKIQAPTGIPNSSGKEIASYGIALSSDANTGRYSTLRVIGSGVSYIKELRRIPTGVSPQDSASEVGITIDNPFLGTPEEVNRTAARAARTYNGTAMELSGSVVAINRRGDEGGLVVQTYAYVESLYSGQTYAQVQALWSGSSYAEVVAELNEPLEDLFENQIFGNVGGARVWDNRSARWYRIRSATITPTSISFDAEDDLNYEDMNPVFQGRTYAQVEASRAGYSYRQVSLMGVRDV